MKSLPNILTIMRLLMVPIFWWMFFVNPVYGGLVFVLACLTDIVDGYLARKLNAITKFGMLVDPLADKLMQISAVVCLFISGVFPQWIVTVLVMKELIMIISASFLVKKEVVIPATKIGKGSTVLLSVMVVYFMIFGADKGIVNDVASAILAIVAFLVLVSYLLLVIRNLVKKSEAIK